MAKTLRSLGEDEKVRVVVLGATGRGFCGGVDIKELARDGRLIVKVNRGCYDSFAAVYDCPVPVIAGIVSSSMKIMSSPSPAQNS